MNNLRLSLMVIMLALVTVVPVMSIQDNKPPESKLPQAMPTTEEVLDKYVQALGGKTAIQAQTSLVEKGTVTVPAIGAVGTIEIYAKVPNKTLTEITSNGFGNSRTGFNGTAAWTEEDGKVSDLTDFAKRDADFYLTIKMQTLYPKIEMKGKEKIGSREAYRLEAPRAGNPERWYFDAETWLLIRTEVRNAEDKIVGSDDYEDYRAVDGVKIPFTTRSLADGIETIIKLTEVKHNVTIDDARFEKPTAKPVAALSSAETNAAAQLKADTLRDVTATLASTEMQGRGIAQRGGEKELPRVRESLQNKLNQWQASNGFPGATIGFVLPDGSYGSVSAGLADVEKKTPLKPQDLMLAGSIGKTFVAAVALQLAQENRVNLDEKIEHWLGNEPWFARLPNSKEIKLRNLLNHSSGVPNNADNKIFLKAFLTTPDMACKHEDLLAYEFDEKPLFAAGTGFSYADTNYILVGMIIEKVTGNTLYNEVSRRLLVPLKLDHTVPSDNRVIPGLIPGYTVVAYQPKTQGKMMIDGKLTVNPGCEWAGGGFASTAEDLARWAKALYEGKVLQKSFLEQMLNGLKIEKAHKFGLAVDITETKFGEAWGHDGEFPGYISDMKYFPQYKTAVAIQFNTERPKNLKRDPDEYLLDVMKIILDEMATAK